MTDAPKLLLADHLKTLKLPTVLREYDKVAQQCAAEGLDHVHFLARLVELELIDRERRMIERRIKEARFPAVKSLDSFDFVAIPSLNKTLVLELARSEYVTRRENIIAVGNSGTGKTHIGLGLGLAACQKGLSVGFYTAAALVHELLEARDEKRKIGFIFRMAAGGARSRCGLRSPQTRSRRDHDRDHEQVNRPASGQSWASGSWRRRWRRRHAGSVRLRPRSVLQQCPLWDWL